MIDPLTWSPLYLGRWSGTPIRVHVLLILFVPLRLLSAVMDPGRPVFQTACWMLLLLAALAVHELGHAVMASWLGCDRDEVRLWPLGNMVGPTIATRSADQAWVALAGPAANLAVVVTTAVGLQVAGAHLVLNPFGNEKDSGAPWLPAAHDTAAPLSPIWWVGWFGYLNWVLLLTNLIPALPFDGGRFLRAVLANSAVVPVKESALAPYTARAFALVLALAGLVKMFVSRMSDGLTLIGLAVLIELMVRTEARMLEDGGFFDDGVFGYDFSEGYTSLESSAAKVRPYRESAIRRWRRRNSERRRQRRQAREAAEERRTDEILEKLYREGRSALTDEEHRFLVRVSAKYRNRPRARE
jgi:Zn-dependent protease